MESGKEELLLEGNGRWHHSMCVKKIIAAILPPMALYITRSMYKHLYIFPPADYLMALLMKGIN